MGGVRTIFQELDTPQFAGFLTSHLHFLKKNDGQYMEFHDPTTYHPIYVKKVDLLLSPPNHQL